jgi:hypothetical protein
MMVAAAFVAVLGVMGVTQAYLDQVAQAAAQATVQAPRFEVDPTWPKPMPKNYLLGQTIGLGVDEKDQVWIIHRGNDPNNLDRTELNGDAAAPTSECCRPAPPVLAFDAAGNLVQAWGGPQPGAAFQWPESNHGIVVDHKGFVWIGGNGGPDAHILKFTRDGKFVAQYGKAGARRDPKSTPEKPSFVGGSNDMDNFGRVAKIFIDPKANEGYVSDGYLNKRVAVIDLDSGKIKRYWGAYGNKPDDAPLPRYTPGSTPTQQFRNPMHCAEMSNDGFVYTCDRPSDRIQIFTREGKFVREVFHEPQTMADGSVWDIAFSRDPEQRYLYLADGANEHVFIYERKSMTMLTQFGYGGRQAGMFLGVHSIATDSKGNIYTTETYTGKRLQKFVFKGVGPVTKVQGVVWPKVGN